VRLEIRERIVDATRRGDSTSREADRDARDEDARLTMKKNVWDDAGTREGGAAGDRTAERLEGARGETYRDDARAVSRTTATDRDGRGALASEGL
jgi:hypothetical protein|tara:strand:+ start:552 stop:836 length:285 start_codon:yes stop_codon:yes gene_type:complete